ncbi:MBL fold metallo-hydrolase [Roseateles saccharophilus]|uniref:Metallo-beta-lactamase family protein n=1 Tax=Roseateles saccharophilus TaxID=304 RepID=A0A4R3UVA0_ROSSA|nr:MBL fold metallo-hydrolase [Roseateles saccharophilus]MDG0833166.1 MBL fold metallo-hydrolase [Roseateles saccharophilus]TCU94633.1 metallo-beta-lactamase family protein [Roseateles saccharophilus]
MKLSFLGAAGTVTGSKYLVEHEGRKLLVDCGLFQGYKQLRLMNWEALPFEPRDVDAVVLTHSHLDHSGALPLLVKRGFSGTVFATPSAIELCQLLLPDSGRIQEEDAEYANRHQTSKHQPAMPLYTEEDAERALRRFEPLPFEQSREVIPGIAVTLRPAGHILGAASIELKVGGETLLFSGDLGRPDDPIMRAPVDICAADHVVVESTYGDRLHEAHATEAVLAETITRTASRGGIVVVPAFAVGRAQLLLYMLYRLKTRGAIPNLPVFLNSPMAIDMTEIYHRHRVEHRLSPEECDGMCKVAKMVRTVEESRALNTLRYPAVIVSASGMATGGRVLHHLKTLAPERRNTVVLAGYQAGGTRGARLQNGERSLRIHGEDVPVNAEVVSLQGLSAHADAQQIVSWLGSAPKAPRGVFITHGEPGPADALRQRIERELGWTATVPSLGQTVEIPS